MMSREDFESLLEVFINRRLLTADPPQPVHRETPLFESGAINSLRVLDLIAFVEETLKITVPDSTIRLANFRSIHTIAQTFISGDHDGRA